MFKKCLIITIFFMLFVLCYKKQEKKEDNTKNQLPKILKKEDYVFGYKSYEEIIEIFKVWEAAAPDLIEIKTYGSSTKGIPLYFIKISNEYNPAQKTQLLTSCIHGNEPLSASVMLAIVGKIIFSYGQDKESTEIINNNTIYFVPIVSPDSYPYKRYVDNVDPNRNFPTTQNNIKESIKPIKCLQELFLKIKPEKVLSGHTYGRILLFPWGEKKENVSNYEEYKKASQKMSELSGYKSMKICDLYGKTIEGTESDWYHKNGSFAMVIEFGLHQKKPSYNDTNKELEKTYSSVLYFIK